MRIDCAHDPPYNFTRIDGVHEEAIGLLWSRRVEVACGGEARRQLSANVFAMTTTQIVLASLVSL